MRSHWKNVEEAETTTKKREVKADQSKTWQSQVNKKKMNKKIEK